MKILLIMFNAATPGGLQYPTRTLMEHLHAHGHDVHLVSNDRPNDWHGISCHVLPLLLGRFGSFIDYIVNGLVRHLPPTVRLWLKVERFIPELMFPRKAVDYIFRKGLVADVDLCICSQHFCADAAQRIRARSDTPYIVIAQGHVFDYPVRTFGLPRYRFFQRATIRSYRNADAVVVVGRRMLNRVVQCRGHDRDVYHIPNGVNLHDFKHEDFVPEIPDPNRALGLLFVGRIETEKGLQYLLPALARLKDGNLQCTLVGSGSRANEYEQLAIALGIDNCYFVGHVDRDSIARYYHEADMVVIPSTAEGHPSVLIEAMACGCPVVGTRIVGIEDVIIHEQNGLLVPAANIDALAAAIQRLKMDAGLRRQLGKAASQTARHYDWQRILPRLQHVIESIGSA